MMLRLFALTAPALDGAIENGVFIADMSPQVRENRIIGSRAPVLLQIIATDPDRDRPDFAADHAFAITHRRAGFEKADRSFRNSASKLGTNPSIVAAPGDGGDGLRTAELGNYQ